MDNAELHWIFFVESPGMEIIIKSKRLTQINIIGANNSNQDSTGIFSYLWRLQVLEYLIKS